MSKTKDLVGEAVAEYDDVAEIVKGSDGAMAANGPLAAVLATDIVFRLSTTSGAAGDSTAGTVAGSLGKYASTTVLTAASLNNLFRDITGAEAAAGIVLYKCIFVLNNNATVTLENAQISVNSQTAGGATADIATDNIAISAKASASAQAAQIASETTAPTGVSAFGAGPLTIGNIAPGQVKGIWVRLTVSAGASAVSPDGVILRVAGDTGP